MLKKFIVLFRENPDAPSSIRKDVFPAHLAFLEEHATQITDAGTLFHADNSRFGGLWIIEADNHSKVVDLVHNDPFWPTGLRLSFEVLEWRKVVEAGRAV